MSLVEEIRESFINQYIENNNIWDEYIELLEIYKDRDLIQVSIDSIDNHIELLADRKRDLLKLL